MCYAIKEENGKRFVVSEPDPIKKGFAGFFGGKDIFFITEKKHKTQSLASAILRKLEYPDNPTTRHEVLFYLQPATLETRTLSNGKEYLVIESTGSTIVDPEGKTVVINL